MKFYVFRNEHHINRLTNNRIGNETIDFVRSYSCSIFSERTSNDEERNRGRRVNRRFIQERKKKKERQAMVDCW
jgi:hypothetical protein